MPLLWLSVAFMAGIIIGSSFSPGWLVLLAALIAEALRYCRKTPFVC